MKAPLDLNALIQSLTTAVALGCAFTIAAAFTSLRIEPWMFRCGVAVGVCVFIMDWFAVRGTRL